MVKFFLLVLCLLLLSTSARVLANTKASDFFKNLSQEKNLLDALYNKTRNSSKKNASYKPFTLAGEGGLLSTSGNTDVSVIKFAFESNHEMTNWSNRYESQFLRRSNKIRTDTNTTQITTERFEISAQFDYKLVQPNSRLFAYIEYDDNEFNLLRDQSSLVTGWSQVAWKKEKSEFRYSIGPGYSRLTQSWDDTRIEEMIVRGTLFYNLKFGENARFRQTLSAELGEQISKAISQSSISAKVLEKLALKFSVNFVLNDNTISDQSVLSSETSISLVYQFF